MDDFKIYLIATIGKISEQDGVEDTRTIGYYLDFETAKKKVETNAFDIHENCYEYAVIEDVGPGLYASTESTPVFFKWDESVHGYREIEMPESLRNFCGFTIG